MIEKCGHYVEKMKTFHKNKKIIIWQKHACQNMVAMETSKVMDSRS